jgi:DNA-binding response OmpR family regulator
MSSSPRRQRVLVIEDDRVTREVLETILDLEEFDVVSVPDGEHALEFVHETEPDVVLLDVRLPNLGGFDICRQIKDDPSTNGVAVVLLTACDDEESRAAGQDAGCDLYMTKPFSPRRLIEEIMAISTGG